MRTRAGISTSEIHFIISKPVSAVPADATEQKCPPPDTKPLAPTVYLLQGRKVDPNLKKISENNFFTSTTTSKIRWIYLWNPFTNPFTITGDICNFVTAMSALSNTSQRSVYNYARRPILRTGLRPVQLFLVLFVSILILYLMRPYVIRFGRISNFKIPIIMSSQVSRGDKLSSYLRWLPKATFCPNGEITMF